MKIFLIICTQLIAMLVIAFAGPTIDVIQLFAGSVRADQIGRWTYGIKYFYFPLSGLMFAIGVICLITGGEARNNQLALTGNEFGFKVLKLWMIQNVVVALLCVNAYMVSSAYLDGRIKHLRNRTGDSRSAPPDTTKARSNSASSTVPSPDGWND